MAKEFTSFTDERLESSLLASIFARPETYWEVADLLPLEAFGSRNRELYKRLSIAIENDLPLPSVPINAAPAPAPDPVAAAKRLAELYQKRLLADLAQTFLEKLRGETSATDLMTELEDNLARVQQRIKERVGDVVALPDLLPEVLSDVAARRQAVKEQGVAAVGLPTGIGKLDKLLGGLQPGLHLLAAEPGMGKTTFALQVAANVAKGYPALFVSFEETITRLALKIICARAGLEAKRFSDGFGEPGELERIAREYGPELARLYFIEGTGKLTVPQLKAKALQIMAREKAGKCLVIVDYLQRWAASRREFNDFRHTVSNLVSELRELALRLSSPVLVISSQNRPGQGSANLTSLKESGDLEYSADTAIFLVDAQKRTATPPSRAVDLAVEKNRYGDKGRVELIFRPDVGIFREVAK